ncbi:MAG: hypothetical protein L0H70_09790, partial [Xanthomonadales bacterium]|nr:hypothetical protein [Xanthomonadales bacterium]
IGRNLNQIAHAVNIDFRYRTNATGETLGQMRDAIDRQQATVTRLVRSTLHRWTGRGREAEGDE